MSYISLFVRVIPEPKHFVLSAPIHEFKNCFAALPYILLSFLSPILKAVNMR